MAVSELLRCEMFCLDAFDWSRGQIWLHVCYLTESTAIGILYHVVVVSYIIL